MKTKIDDGGPAFPIAYPVVDGQPGGGNDGMTLRGYFAAKALPEVLTIRSDALNALSTDEKMKKIGELAYLIADAMLAARKGE